MQFNSFIFILLFLPCFLVSYFCCSKVSRKLGNVILILSGLLFYGFLGLYPVTVLLISSVLSFLFSRMIEKHDGKIRNVFLCISVSLNILLLAFYKISGFSGFPGTLNIVMPLGISFYSFQQIMYVVNVYRGKIKKTDALDYFTYILFFPKLIMGPIVEPSDLISQVNDDERRKMNIDNLACGLKIFSFGLFKKIILADTFMRGVDWGFEYSELASSLDLIMIMLYYSFEIYFDFSGYIDMATGVAKMINIDLPINFDSPYKAVSFRDFWKRWHISLTGFFTEYIYYPLGGNRKGRIRTYINIMIVFLISGFWHGSNWTFVLWGALHGLLQIIERILDKPLSKLWKILRWVATFGITNVLWLLFRSDSIAQWAGFLKRMVTIKNISINGGLINVFVLPETSLMFRLLHITNANGVDYKFSIVFFTLAGLLICLIPKNNYRTQKNMNVINMVLASAAFVWSFLCLSSESVFVYYNF